MKREYLFVSICLLMTAILWFLLRSGDGNKGLKARTLSRVDYASRPLSSSEVSPRPVGILSDEAGAPQAMGMETRENGVKREAASARPSKSESAEQPGAAAHDQKSFPLEEAQRKIGLRRMAQPISSTEGRISMAADYSATPPERLIGDEILMMTEHVETMTKDKANLERQMVEISEQYHDAQLQYETALADYQKGLKGTDVLREKEEEMRILKLNYDNIEEMIQIKLRNIDESQAKIDILKKNVN